jgi:CheY-like chemotaxis protein
VNTLFASQIVRHAESLPSGTETILVVEDDTGLRNIVTHVLESCGFNVISAASGDSALEYWGERKDQIELVLTDVAMPGMTGWELTERLHRERPELKVIFMTAHGGELKGRGKSLVKGINFVPKPYQVLKLARTVRDRLDSPD